jgi:23S rRNA pseudouridine2457 synthase
LKKFDFPKGVYPCGRLDADSEGLLILTNDGYFNQILTNPKYKKIKTYWAQVERIIDEEALLKIRNGIVLNDGPTLPAEIKIMEEPALPPRIPPIRYRKTVPTSWVELKIREGRNRQVRRMLAHVGYPVLRLFRYSIGDVNTSSLEIGQWRYLSEDEILNLKKERK